jgi:hypothetical protein
MGLISIGLDNGVSGSIGIIGEGREFFSPMPVKEDLNYQKTEIKHIKRVDWKTLWTIIENEVTGVEYGRMNKMTPGDTYLPSTIKAMIERPMVNPLRWEASMSAIRALEAVLIILENLRIGYEFCDSKDWQRNVIDIGRPKVPKDTPEKIKKKIYEENSRKIKRASLEKAKQYFPAQAEAMEAHGDADGMLIARFNYYKLGGRIE